MPDVFDQLMVFFNENQIQIVWIIVLFFLGKMILGQIVRALRRFVDDGNDAITTQGEKRMHTLGVVVRRSGNIVINIVILLMALDLFGVDIGPILAGAGILGLAVSFGAQSLVKDLVAGLFILIENQYGIGDKVTIDNTLGVVHKMNIRTTVLCAEDGKIVYIQNGQVDKVINHTQKKEHC